MKKDPFAQPASPDIHPIRHNRSTAPMTPVVREFADLLADIAIRQLRAQERIAQGETPHD